MQQLNIKVKDTDDLITSLSGGNQQKVMPGAGSQLKSGTGYFR